MKVLMINVVCGIRSTGRICTDLAKELEARGHEVKIAYGRENVPEQFRKYAVRIGTDLSVKFHGVKARLFDGAGFGSKSATSKFIEWVKDYNPDVIHLHNIHGYYLNIEVLFDYLKICGKKVIWTLHDCWSITGHTAYCDSVDCRKWINGCADCPLIGEYPTSYIDCSKRNWIKKKQIFTGVPNMEIVTPSKWLASCVKNSFLKFYSVRIINNGIDTSQFTPTESDFRKKKGIEDKFVLLGVASVWDKMKGLNDFLKLAQILDNRYIIVLVGLTRGQIANMPNNILGIEKTNSIKELAEIYTAADLFLNLSLCENYPTVNLEAIACDTPVITYETGGSPESASYYGKSVPKGDLGKLVEAIVHYKGMTKKTMNVDYMNVVLKYLELYGEM